MRTNVSRPQYEIPETHIMTYTTGQIDAIVHQRMSWRRKRGYSTPWGSARQAGDFERIGVVGEVAFAEEFDLLIDTNEHPNGDKGIDFHTSVGTVDVKTTRFNRNPLKVRVDKPIADYIVLAQYNERTGRARLVGWASKDEVEGARRQASNQAPKFHDNFIIPRVRLHEMNEFRGMLRRNKVAA